MRRLRTNTARLWLLIGLLAWLCTTSAQQVHEAVVQHIRCADHGQLVEVDSHTSHADASASLDGNDSNDSNDSDEHDQHCDLDLSLAVALPTLTPPLVPHLGRWAPEQQPPQLGAPRGPPLTWAPKTSPPTIS